MADLPAVHVGSMTVPRTLCGRDVPGTETEPVITEDTAGRAADCAFCLAIVREQRRRPLKSYRLPHWRVRRG